MEEKHEARIRAIGIDMLRQVAGRQAGRANIQSGYGAERQTLPQTIGQEVVQCWAGNSLAGSTPTITEVRWRAACGGM